MQQDLQRLDPRAPAALDGANVATGRREYHGKPPVRVDALGTEDLAGAEALDAAAQQLLEQLGLPLSGSSGEPTQRYTAASPSAYRTRS
jgi:hypothetical protein